MATKIKSKARVYGECITSWELLTALKSPLFFDADAPVTISTRFITDTLRMVYVCPYCSKLHLVAGKLKEDLVLDEQSAQAIYLNHLSDGKYITKSELIDLLENLQEVRPVVVQHLFEDKAYNLTEVINCNEQCPAVHLESSYDKDCIYLS